MTPPLESTPEEPPPYRWLRRGLLATACLLLALLALRLAAGWAADRRLAAHEAALRTAGHLATPEDLNDPPLPDGQNAAYFYRRAAAAITYTPAQEAVVTAYNAPPPTAANLPLRRAAVVRNRQPLADLRTARTLGVDWGIVYRRPLFPVIFRYWNDQRDLARLLCAAAGVAAADGDSAEAVERVIDSLRLADAQWGPLNSSHGIGTWIVQRTADEVQALLPTLTIKGAGVSPTTSPTGLAVGRGRLLELIHDLLDEGPQRRGAVRAYQGNHVFNDDYMQCLADEGWLLSPAFNAAATDLLPWDRQLERAAERPTASTVGALQALNVPELGPADFQRMFASGWMWVARDQRAVADRRLAAVALAVRLYQTDHAGRRPAALADLVPAYLPAVPADPFRPDAGPLGYAPAFAPTPPPPPNPSGPVPPPSPRLYSVGADGLDAGGAGDPSDRWGKSSSDAPFLLAPE